MPCDVDFYCLEMFVLQHTPCDICKKKICMIFLNLSLLRRSNSCVPLHWRPLSLLLEGLKMNLFTNPIPSSESKLMHFYSFHLYKVGVHRFCCFYPFPKYHSLLTFYLKKSQYYLKYYHIVNKYV